VVNRSSRSIIRYLWAVTILFVPVNAVARASLVFSNGLFLVRVDPPGLAPIDNFLQLDSNPFEHTQISSYGDSWTAAQLAMSWSGDNGDFHLDTQQHLQGFTPGVVETSGNFIRLTPSIDSILTLHMEYSYNHPTNQIGSASISAGVQINGTNTFIWSDAAHGGNVGLGPTSGLLSIDTTLPLPAGTTYVFDYHMFSNNFGTTSPPPPNALWLGDGQIDLTLRPIPEPAALLPLVVLLFLAQSRRSRRAGTATPPAPPLYELSIINYPFLWER
jgi:hypothetical protein